MQMLRLYTVRQNNVIILLEFFKKPKCYRNVKKKRKAWLKSVLIVRLSSRRSLRSVD
ncbi:hypothetical protein KsCSTR_17970 [Candidatus Kuenenia stuttgartiensis]|uniref:Uncharacterized protein n=1 Tax=Kuenenia stuttgartiensis TaxID=174633 RepID=Q1Q2A9_KUEST|nr:hypothetical protein KsCSTR_17970 [Candidatus Kuenenia stuttgartiensis]CAJ74147.1 unknown protein [Candidatus Kuenenia stuttgartiensis]